MSSVPDAEKLGIVETVDSLGSGKIGPVEVAFENGIPGMAEDALGMVVIGKVKLVGLLVLATAEDALEIGMVAIGLLDTPRPKDELVGLLMLATAEAALGIGMRTSPKLKVVLVGLIVLAMAEELPEIGLLAMAEEALKIGLFDSPKPKVVLVGLIAKDVPRLDVETADPLESGKQGSGKELVDDGLFDMVEDNMSDDAVESGTFGNDALDIERLEVGVAR